MKYNKKLAVYALLPALGLLGTAGVASAHGFGMGGLGGGTPEEFAVRQQTLFAEGASLLGVSVDEIKVAWAKGQNLQDLAIAKGITKDQLMQKMKDRRIAEHKANLQALVTRGVITQGQADSRLTFMQTMADKKPSTMMKGEMKGVGRGRL